MIDWMVVIAIVFAAMLALFALAQCMKDESAPWHSKLVYSIIIVALPVVGAVIYLRQRDELDELNQEDGRRSRRRRRRR